MKEPSLQKTTALSFALHLSLLLIALLVLRQSNHFVIPSAYVVSLVSPKELKGIARKENVEATKTLKGTSVTENIPEKVTKRVTEKEEENAEERIAAIAAKRRVERLMKLRSMLSLKASSNDKKDSSEQTSVYAGKGTLFDDYYEKIRKEIWQQWAFPDTGQKNLETIISIKVMKDGTIFVQKIEKSSGNIFFDRSAIKALTKASPLSPPPYEMEIGIRFFP